jgi:hypothetical protein
MNLSELDNNQILTLLLAGYGALLSTWLVVKGWIDKIPKLSYIHKFEKDSKGVYMEIHAENSSERSLTVHSVEYHLGASEALRKIPMVATEQIDPFKSASFKIYLNDDIEYLQDVSYFNFKLSSNKTLTYKLERTILEEFRRHIFSTSMPDLFFEVEKVNDSYNNIIQSFKKELASNPL